jgi:hypothetical protein
MRDDRHVIGSHARSQSPRHGRSAQSRHIPIEQVREVAVADLEGAGRHALSLKPEALAETNRVHIVLAHPEVDFRNADLPCGIQHCEAHRPADPQAQCDLVTLIPNSPTWRIRGRFRRWRSGKGRRSLSRSTTHLSIKLNRPPSRPSMNFSSSATVISNSPRPNVPKSDSPHTRLTYATISAASVRSASAMRRLRPSLIRLSSSMFLGYTAPVG